MALLSQNIALGSWTNKTYVCLYSPEDLNSACARSGCFTFDTVILTNRLPGRRISGEVICPSGNSDVTFSATPQQFELGMKKMVVLTLGMYVSNRSETTQLRRSSFIIECWPTVQQVRRRSSRQSGIPSSSTGRDGMEVFDPEELSEEKFEFVHADAIGINLVSDDGSGSNPRTQIHHSCFRNDRHDRVCRLQAVALNEALLNRSQRNQLHSGNHSDPESAQGTTQAVETIYVDSNTESEDSTYADESASVHFEPTGAVTANPEHRPVASTAEESPLAPIAEESTVATTAELSPIPSTEGEFPEASTAGEPPVDQPGSQGEVMADERLDGFETIAPSRRRPRMTMMMTAFTALAFVASAVNRRGPDWNTVRTTVSWFPTSLRESFCEACCPSGQGTA